jgi:Tol biopolymer transport system component
MQTPSELGHYRILRRLGGGGMGEVFLAEDRQLQRKVALKTLPSYIASDPEHRARFEQEARAIAALNHPNIVTVHSIERSGDVSFITMEWVDGGLLRDVVQPQGLTPPQFLDIAIPLVSAVSAAHNQGIAHRDLKPENVMVGTDGRVKVLDFGLAKLTGGISTSDDVTVIEAINTGEGRIVGTVAYMSPEQAEGRTVDRRTDIFSLGVIFHELLTGSRPFTGESQAAVISSILRDTPAPVSEVNAAIPRELSRIAQRCLAKDPGQRYQDAADLRHDLEQLKQDLTSGSLLAPLRFRRWHRLAWLLLAAIIGLPILVWAPWPRRRPPDPANATFKQVTHDAGEELSPSLSPDGNTVVYVSGTSGNLDVYSLRVGGENPVNLTRESTADDSQPAFSPDGDRIAFRSERDGGGIFVMGATGESVRRLTDFGYNPAWSPDGRSIVCVTGNLESPALRLTRSELWRVDVASGKRVKISDGDAAQPRWSPNSSRIAYSSRSAERATGDIWTIAETGGEPVAVTTDAANDWTPEWSPDGRFLYFASDRGGSMNLWRVRIAEPSGKVLRDPEPVTRGAGLANQSPALSRDGRRIMYVAQQASSNVHRVAFDPDAETITGATAHVTRGTRPAGLPSVSPDGDLIAFEWSGNPRDIAVVRPDGTGLRQLTDDAHRDSVPVWSPDGKRVAFHSDRSGAYELWVIGRDGSGLRQLTEARGAHYAAWSPDGRFLSYAIHNPQRAVIFEVDRPWKEQKPRVLPNPGQADQLYEIASWAPDGKRVAGHLHRADRTHGGIGIHTLGTRSIEWAVDFGEFPVWLKDGRRLLFVGDDKLFLVDTRTKRVKEIFSAPNASIGQFALAPDNRTIYYTVSSREADIWMAEMR